MAAVCQPLAASPPNIVSRGFLVEVKRLRIELGAECLGSLLVDPQPTGAKGLPNGKVFEESPTHFIDTLSDRPWPLATKTIPS
jgi:hypothetical protein